MVAPRPRRLALLTLLSCSPSSPNGSLLAGSPAPQPTTSDYPIAHCTGTVPPYVFLRRPLRKPEAVNKPKPPLLPDCDEADITGSLMAPAEFREFVLKENLMADHSRGGRRQDVGCVLLLK